MTEEKRFTPKELERASKIAIKGLQDKMKSMSSGEIQALRGLANSFTPLRKENDDQDRAKEKDTKKDNKKKKPYHYKA